ncbi:ferredoxin reductase [Labrys okinawensis]|uniref:Ferredoxin reductase n=2 Tax=Labrys okinawensis TaxID=346911 RepID=A0A2S9Q4P4_9HYPH|nr:ferredoxin reductase [Labrys okinawensis]
MQPGMVIVGAGEAGARAAFALRENGWAGSITLIGDEVHAPYERPPLSKAALLDEAGPSPRYIVAEARFEAEAILHLAKRSVVAIEPDRRLVRLDDGNTLAYEKLLLATGAAPRRLPLAGANRPGCVTLRRFEDALHLRERFRPGAEIAIIGGGFIGLELAASARQRGAAVTIIEALPRLLSRGVPADIAEVVQERHRAAGCTLLCGEGIAAIEEEPDGLAVRLTSGKLVLADLVVLGVGASPSTALAEAAGLAIDNGIAVDSRLRTSDEAVFAAGDCCSFPLPVYGGRRVRLESWRNAQEQGAHAARAMLGENTAFDAIPWFWSDQYDLSLQVAGLVDEGRRTIRRDGADGSFILCHLADDGRLVAASGIGPGNAIAKDIRLCEMLIAKRAHPNRDRLGDPNTRLKSLLAA